MLEKKLESHVVAYKSEGETWVVERERLEGEINVCKTRIEAVMGMKKENDLVVEREMKKDKSKMQQLEKQMQIMEREVGERDREMDMLKKKVKRTELKMRMEREGGLGVVVKTIGGSGGGGGMTNKKWTTLKPVDCKGGEEDPAGVTTRGGDIYASKIRVLESDLDALEARLN